MNDPIAELKDMLIEEAKKGHVKVKDNGTITLGSEISEQIIGKIKETKEDILDVTNEKREIILPKGGRLISQFAEELGESLKETKQLFFRTDIKEIVEIGKIKIEGKEDTFIGFIIEKPNRFVTFAEQYMIPVVEVWDEKRKQYSTYKKSMSSELANNVLKSPMMQEVLPKINRIFTVPLPIIYDGKLTFPKKGYDERFNSWLPYDSPEIKEISLEKAKEIIYELFKDFCFQSKQDYTNAIAALITPFLRGMYARMSARTPLFFYIANRERSGKDYCAGITGIVYEGMALEEPPISNGESHSHGMNDELRKKILSGFISGKKRMHFSNNKGYIDNAAFEGILTSEQYSDRVLGKNESLVFNNEVEFSLSGNIGIGFTPDLANRSKFIRFFLEVEDANSRVFSNPDLHGWVKNNRDLILSAIFALIKNWFENGCPSSKIGFTSFPEWARVCGGIMDCGGYDNPCMQEVDNLILGGDNETSDMKRLFEICFEKYPNESISMQKIQNLILEEEIFKYFDFTKRSDQIKFGNKILKFIGRQLSNITMKVRDETTRPSRYEYIFTKNTEEKNKSIIFGNVGNVNEPEKIVKKTDITNITKIFNKNPIRIGNLGNLGNLGNHISKNENDIIRYNDIPLLPTLPILPKLDQFTDEEIKQAGWTREELESFVKPNSLTPIKNLDIIGGKNE